MIGENYRNLAKKDTAMELLYVVCCSKYMAQFGKTFGLLKVFILF